MSTKKKKSENSNKIFTHDDVKHLLNHGKIKSAKFSIDDKHDAIASAVANDNSSITVSVTIYDHSSATGSGPHHQRIQKTVADTQSINAVALALIRSFTTQSAKNNSPVKRQHTTKVFKQQVEAVPGIRSPASFGIRKTKRYLAQSTLDARVSYFIETIGGMYQHFGTFDVPEAMQEAYRDNLIAEIYNRQSRNEAGAYQRIANSVNQKWREANEILEFCRTADSQSVWPANPIPYAPALSAGSVELLKVLPQERYIKCLVLLYRACLAEIPEAYACAGCVTCGMRIGESSALVIGKFEVNGQLCRYYVDHQIDKNNQLTDKLKNDYSYRYVPIYGLMIEIVNLRRKQLENKGFSDAEINDSFLGSDNSSLTTPVKRSRENHFVKELLQLSGVNAEEMELIIASATSDAGKDSEHSFTSHLFRRIQASYAANGGCLQREVDAMLGHENDENDKLDYATWDAMSTLTQKLSRAIYTGSLSPTINPAHTPVALNKNISFNLLGNYAYHFVAESDGYISADVSTLETDSPLVFTVSRNTSNKVDITPLPISDTKEQKLMRPVLPKHPTEKEIESWINEAWSIDISCLQ